MEEIITNAGFMGGGLSSVVGLGIFSVLCNVRDYNHFSGSSLGALIAVCLADGKDPFEIKEFLQDHAELFCTPIKGQFAIEKAVNEFIGVKSMCDLKYGCTIAVTPLSLNPDAPRILDSSTFGFNCGEAVAASMAYPGIFLPKVVEVNGKRYIFVDGGFTSNPPLPYTGKDEEFVNVVYGFYRTKKKPINRYIPVSHTELYFAPTKTGITGTSSDVRTGYYEGAEYGSRMLQASSEIWY